MLQRSVDICRIDGNEKKKQNGGTEIGMGRERDKGSVSWRNDSFRGWKWITR